MSNIIIETDKQNGIILSGDIQTVLCHRRAIRMLKDIFRCEIDDNRITVEGIGDLQTDIGRIKKIVEIAGCSINYSEKANDALQNYINEEEKFEEFSQKALSIRNNECELKDFQSFKDSLIDNFTNRTLYPLQLLSAYHLAFSQNACNFSVPGAGKTSVVYAAYSYLKNMPDDSPKRVDRLLIIGPLSSFDPWETEYSECFGKQADAKRLVGPMTLEEKRQYLYDPNPAEITLMSYQSVVSLVDELKIFLSSNRTMVVLDEAHKIKNHNGGIIAESILSLSARCRARAVLTGTPAPNGYDDLYNIFSFIWPGRKVIRFSPGQLRDMSKNDDDYRIDTLIDQISPFFVRVKKSDLGIPPAVIHPPIVVPMKDSQRRLYDFVEGTSMSSIADSDNSIIGRAIRKARLIRMMQAATNPNLLNKPLKEYAAVAGEELKLVDDDSIIASISSLIPNEVPAKFEKTLELVNEIIQGNQKVIVWACYIQTIEELSEYFTVNGINNKVLYGKTPVAADGLTIEDEDYEFTREAIVKEFNDISSGLKVIIANPFAVSESISLHKACHNAVYLERSFNAAHFIQSKDRIHRYGLKPDTVTNYYYLVSENSIDETINDRLEIKENRLNEIMESMPIPLFSNVKEDEGDEDIKALMRDYARRIKTL